MRRYGFAVVVLVVLTVPQALASAPSSLNLLGDVRAGSAPVESALVISFGLSSYEAVQTWTDPAGSFRFPPLPSGVYRIIAVKSGFAPAIATVAPAGALNPLRLRLTRGETTPEAREQIWKLRRSLPADILRELDYAIGVPEEHAELPQFVGAMSSLASLDYSGRGGSLAQTDLSLSGGLRPGWRLELAGRHLESDSLNPTLPGSGREIRASGVEMSLVGADDSLVRVASNRNEFFHGSADGGLESHRIEWSRAGTRVAVHYLQNDDALPSSYGGGSVEVTGDRTLWNGDSADLAVGVRLVQETGSGLIPGRPDQLQLADLSTTAGQKFGELLEIRYGVRARLGTDVLASWSPESTATLHLGGRTSLIASGQVKMDSHDERWMLWPAIVELEDASGGPATPRYRYRIGVLSGDSRAAEFSAVVSVTSVDDPVTLLFGEIAADVWDAYLLTTGDRHDELRLRYRRSFARERLALEMQSHAARTRGTDPEEDERGFFQSRVRSIYVPSGTSVEVAYRRVDQPEPQTPLAFDLSGERLNLRMGQSLHLPLDLTLLVGVDLARELVRAAAEGPENNLRLRYVGGVALAF